MACIHASVVYKLYCGSKMTIGAVVPMVSITAIVLCVFIKLALN